MNPVLAEIESTGTMALPTGEVIKVHSHVGPGAGRVIRRAVEVAKPTIALEVGLAYGISSLYILDALAEIGDGRLIGMDPAQHDSTWRGGGLHNVRRAGYADRYEFHEDTSQRVLPRLAESGTRIQLGFIDGWHTFDHTLVDFFYIDHMLDVGGIVILDDVEYPGLRRLAHFIVSNRDYVILDLDPIPGSSTWRNHLKRIVQFALRPLTRDNFTPSESIIVLEQEVNKAQLIALLKTDQDKRSFDHFVAF